MKFRHFFPGLSLFIIVTVLLCLPGSDLPGGWFSAHIPQFDKLVHIGLFTALCLSISYPIRYSNQDKTRQRQYLLLIALGGIVYGTVMELVQKYWVTGRSFEIYDILADSMGCLLALGICIKNWPR